MPHQTTRPAALLAAVLLFCAPALAETLYLHCGALLDKPGEDPRGRSTVVVMDGVIESVADGFVQPDDDDIRVINLRGRFVTPGLIDCHTHITHEMSKGERLRRTVVDTDADAAIQATVYAERTLRAGFTTIRNVGSGGDVAFALRDAIARGAVPGPRMLVAGRSVTPTGGHGDSTNGVREDLFAIPGAYQGVADGIAECRKAVRAQVKRGADLIKITATGGVLSHTDAGTGQQFHGDELRAIVETAALLGRKVAAHAHDTGGINAALRAGVHSIEHGSFIDDESVELFQRSGAYIVPTLMAGETVATIAEDDPDYFIPPVRRKALAVGPEMLKNFRKAVEGGVNIAFGTDSGVSPHGDNAREFELMVEAGMTPSETLHAATIAAATLCGIEDEVGTIEPGKQADIVAFAESPLENISAVWDVVFVMKGGEVYRQE